MTRFVAVVGLEDPASRRGEHYIQTFLAPEFVKFLEDQGARSSRRGRECNIPLVVWRKGNFVKGDDFEFDIKSLALPEADIPLKKTWDER